MKNLVQGIDPLLAEELILEEIFDLTLYERFREIAGSNLRAVLDDLIVVEKRHAAFWQEFFGIKIGKLNFGRRIKLSIIFSICRVFGEKAIHLVLEAVEVHGIGNYLRIWEQCGDTPLKKALRDVLDDEFQHEDTIVSRFAERAINPEKVRSIFLGFNDGLVEMVGAVSGFFAAFGRSIEMIVVASLTVAVAGSLSMAAGAYVASSSEEEIKGIQRAKAKYLGDTSSLDTSSKPLSLSIVVGVSYFLGAILPILPVMLGAENIFVSLVTAVLVIIMVSLVLSFLSGMDVKKRILTNLVILVLAVGVTYLIGNVVKNVWGITL